MPTQAHSSILKCKFSRIYSFEIIIFYTLCCLFYLICRTQHACAILSHSVETICFVSPSEPPNTPSDGSYPETKYLLAGCRKIQNELTKYLPAEQNNQKTITDRHTEVILNQLKILMQMPICMPRFFFQVLQNTSIKLALQPPPRATGDPITVQPGSSLVVKVEGVIQHSAKTPSLYRSVDSVQLHLTSQLTTPKPADFKMPSDTITLTQTVNFVQPKLNINFQSHIKMFQANALNIFFLTINY